MPIWQGSNSRKELVHFRTLQLAFDGEATLAGQRVNLKIVLGQINSDSDKLLHGRSPSFVEPSGYHVLGVSTPLRRGRPQHQICGEDDFLNVLVGELIDIELARQPAA